MAFGDVDLDFWDQYLAANIVNMITVAYCLACLVVFYNRKDHFPIQGRGSTAILLAAWIYFILLVRIAFRGPLLPCVVDSAIYLTGTHCGSAIYVYRVAVLLIKQDIARDASLSTPPSTLRISQAWRWARHQLLHTKRWAIFLFCYGALLLFEPAKKFTRQKSNKKEENPCVCLQACLCS